MQENWFEMIDDFLKGNMSHKEQALFEAELKTNEELYTAFSLYQQIEQEMRLKEDDIEKETFLTRSLEKLSEKYFKADPELTENAEREKGVLTYLKNNQPDQPGKRKLNLWQWQAAAIFTGLISLCLLWWVSPKKQDPQQAATINIKSDSQNINGSLKTIGTDTSSRQSKIDTYTASAKTPQQKRKKIVKIIRDMLFAKNFKSDKLPEDIPAPLEDPSAFYKAKSHNKAILEYHNLLAEIEEAKNSGIVTRGEDEDIKLTAFYAHYYLAQSYININNTTKALKQLDSAIIKAPDNFWKSKAQWYKALAYLKAGKVDSAEILLKEIANNKYASQNKEKAIKLIDELKL